MFLQIKDIKQFVNEHFLKNVSELHYAISSQGEAGEVDDDSGGGGGGGGGDDCKSSYVMQ